LNTPFLAVASRFDAATQEAQKWFGIKRFGAQHPRA